MHILDPKHLLTGVGLISVTVTAPLLITPVQTIDLKAGVAAEATLKTLAKHHLCRMTHRRLALVPLLLEAPMRKMRQHLACTGILLVRMVAMVGLMQRLEVCQRRRLPSRQLLLEMTTMIPGTIEAWLRRLSLIIRLSSHYYFLQYGIPTKQKRIVSGLDHAC